MLIEQPQIREVYDTIAILGLWDYTCFETIAPTARQPESKSSRRVFGRYSFFSQTLRDPLRSFTGSRSLSKEVPAQIRRRPGSP